MTPEDLRESIPALERVDYLNTGATGPSPRRVVEATQAYLARHEYDAPREGVYDVAFEAYERSREAIAAHLGCAPTEIALTESTVDGVTRIAGAIPWESGDVVVRTDLEHPAGVLPWRGLARLGVEERVVPTDDGAVDLEAYTAAVADATLVVFSAISWNYGTRLPAGELVAIAREAGALTLVDAVQVPGQDVLPVDAWGADAVVASGHKWLLGPWGAGFLHVDDAVADRLEPLLLGYRGVDPDADFAIRPGAARVEMGTANPAPHVGLEAAIETIEAVGLDAIRSRIERLVERFKAGVPAGRLLSPPDFESGLVSIAVDEPDATVERLHREGVVIRAIPAPPCVRVSIHAFNTAAEVDRVLSLLAAEW